MSILNTLKKTSAWTWCSLYIRARDKYTCFTCGKIDRRPKMMHAGHMIQGFGHGATFFLERNLAAQCYNCNVNGYGMGSLFKSKFIEKYGEDEYKRLYKLSKDVKQWTQKELKELARYYKGKYEELSTLSKE